MCIFKTKATKKNEFVEVYHDIQDGSFYFKTIPERKYAQMMQGKWDTSVDAAFIVSSDAFDKAGQIAWSYIHSDILYITGVVINPSACEMVCDILHDFMVISGMERGKAAIRLQVANDSLLAVALAKEDDYRVAGHIDGYAYFEADVASFQ